MGLLAKSLTILLIAVSTPLIYRQFVNEGTVKYMSSYYSNYKVIDQFLRQSAGHIDRAKEYLPETDQLKEQFKDTVTKLNDQVLALIQNIKSKTQAQDKKEETTSDSVKKATEEKKPKKDTAVKMSSCPGESNPVRVWTKAELSEHDGSRGETIYLAFLGTVYDVSINSQHYSPGSEYSVFAGRDATRAFITGNFTHDLNDDITDIEESMYSHVEGWQSFYSTSYPNMGRLVGRFYDSQGCGTAELYRVQEMFAQLAQEKEVANEQDKEYPECNSEWNNELKSGRVWCSKQSGGVERAWVGSPRILNNSQQPKCVCLNLDDPNVEELNKVMSPYPDCDPNASECLLK